jgi:hypothetical protein
MNTEERLNLKKLLSQSDCEDNTEAIRRIKHSGMLLDAIRDMEKLKKIHAELRRTSPTEYEELCKVEVAFLYNCYTDLFNKQLKDELNLVIMIKLIRVLELIEQGQVDQHEGSVLVGKFLKEMYVDSAIRRGENLDAARDAEKATTVDFAREPAKHISWKQFKASGAK